MPVADYKSIDEYECYLGETLERWTPQQRVALAAAMAERWLPTYEAFSRAEDWGDAPALRRTLEAIWGHVRGRKLSSSDLARYREQLHDSTPHMDDFEAPEALGACVVLAEALDCCKSDDNVYSAVRAALSGFEAAVPDLIFEEEEQSRLWRRAAAKKELRKQLRLVEQIGGTAHFDEESVETLRRGLTSADLVGEVSKKPKAAACSVGMTNQAAFEQYRRLVESQLRRPPWSPDSIDEYTLGIMIFAEWGARYLQRRRAIDGTNGRLADVFAHPALVARQRSRDAAEAAAIEWASEIREVMNLCISNAHSEYDVHSLEQPHGYGPSLRRLWAEAKRQGQSDTEAWNSVIAWTRHRPTAWEAEDRRKKKGLVYSTPEMGGHLARELRWTATNDLDHPWATNVAGELWRVRLNDFPDEILYSLVIGETVVGDFHDWPETWRR